MIEQSIQRNTESLQLFHELWPSLFFVDYANEKAIKITCYSGNMFLPNLKVPLIKRDESLDYWCNVFYNSIKSLTTLDETEKKEIIKKTTESNNVFQTSNLIRLRSNNKVNKKMIEKYSKIIQEISDVSLKLIKDISSMPIFMARYINKHENRTLSIIMMGMYYVKLGYVPNEEEYQ